MRVRIRFHEGPRVHRRKGKNRHLAAAFATLLSPLAVMAAVLGIWRICADIGLTGEFAISRGIFSHWQVWLAIAVIVQVLAVLLDKYGTHDERRARPGEEPPVRKVTVEL